jgi:hypothetical protein
VHPGRAWALDSRLVDSLSPTEIENRVNSTLGRVPARLDHTALLDEMLAGFRQDDTVSHERDEPPVGEDAAGPEPDEAGGADDA